MRYLLLLTFVLFSANLVAEDSLVFCKRSNNLKEHKVVLNEFPFKVVCIDGTKFKAMIADVRDSMIVFLVFKNNRQTRILIKEQDSLLFDYHIKKGITGHRFDSLIKEVQKVIYKIQYSEERMITVSSIKKLKHRKISSSKKLKRLHAIGISDFLLGFAGNIVVMAAGFSPPIPEIVLFAIWTPYLLFKYIDEIKRLNLKKIWKIKRVIRT